MLYTPKNPRKTFVKAAPLSALVALLVLSAPHAAFSHVGHGDEFQATGGVQRVKVNSETDSMLGIKVDPIAPATDGTSAVLIPATALVDGEGKQLVFVQYENFYEPVEVTVGTTKGNSVEITQGLSVGEKLVTQGSLSLYAESRKSQTADAAASPAPTANSHAQADAQGIPHSHDAAGNMAQQPSEQTQPSQSLPLGLIAGGAGVALLGVGAVAALGGDRKKKKTFSDK
jgi:membrane fusion protein, cation efflux system